MGILFKLLSSITCPYQDKDCPKIAEVRNTDKGQDKRLMKIERILYAIMGMIAIEWGINLW